MIRGFKALDRVLRGEATRLPALRDGTIDIPAGLLIIVLVILGMVAGAEGLGGIHFSDFGAAQATGVIALVLILYAGGLGVRTAGSVGSRCSRR